MKLTPARKSSLKVKKKYFLNSSNKVGDKSKIYFSFHVSAFRIIYLFISFPEKTILCQASLLGIHDTLQLLSSFLLNIFSSLQTDSHKSRIMCFRVKQPCS